MSNRTIPRVSVVMAAHNVGPYVEAAVNGILRQTYADFELIVIDDGSTDDTWEVLTRLAAQDGRICLERNRVNLGISATRNRGTAIARGELLAIVDADDISLPYRLEKQVAYLDEHPEIGVVGGQLLTFLEKEGEFLPASALFALTPGHAAWHLHFARPVMHPTAMLRRSLLIKVGGYRPEYVIAGDCDLWQRLGRHTKMANLPDILIHYRRHDSNITLRLQQSQEEVASIAQAAIEATLGTPIAREEVMQMLCLRDTEPQRAAAICRRLFDLANSFLASTPLTPEERRLVRRDAAHSMMRIVRRHRVLSRGALRGLVYVARLDMPTAARWVLHIFQRSAQHRFSTGLKRAGLGSPS